MARMTAADLFEILPARHAVLLLEFLSTDEISRQRIAVELRTLLDRQRDAGTGSSGSIPCRRPLGSTVLLAPLLAWWLFAALELPAGELNELCARIR